MQRSVSRPRVIAYVTSSGRSRTSPWTSPRVTASSAASPRSPQGSTAPFKVSRSRKASCQSRHRVRRSFFPDFRHALVPATPFVVATPTATPSQDRQDQRRRPRQEELRFKRRFVARAESPTFVFSGFPARPRSGHAHGHAFPRSPRSTAPSEARRASFQEKLRFKRSFVARAESPTFVFSGFSARPRSGHALRRCHAHGHASPRSPRSTAPSEARRASFQEKLRFKKSFAARAESPTFVFFRILGTPSFRPRPSSLPRLRPRLPKPTCGLQSCGKASWSDQVSTKSDTRSQVSYASS